MIGAWKYNDPKRQTAWFRGYWAYYTGSTKVFVASDKVRKTKGAALRDAKKLERKTTNYVGSPYHPLPSPQSS